MGALLLALGKPVLFPDPLAAQQDGPLQILTFPDAKLQVAGLPWFQEDKPLLFRLPTRLKGQFRKELWELAQDPSGGRIRFKTDSKRLVLKARCESDYTMYHITSIGQNGFDLYVDGFYQGSTQAVGPNGEETGTWDLGPDGLQKEITLYLPLYKKVIVREIDLDPTAFVKPASDFVLKGPVVYYGTSITQGGCASNPGMAYPAILGRRLNVDFVNLGFSGNGKGDQSIAQIIPSIKPSAVVLDYWANVNADEMKKTLGPFVETLRRSLPTVPILVIGPYYSPMYGFDEEKKKNEEDLVAARKKAGDKNIAFIDGLTMIDRGTAYALVDGLHCNTLGFQRIADALEGPLARILGLEKTKAPSEQ